MPMRTTHKRSCSGCYWCCQCEDRNDDVCEDYTPLDPEEIEEDEISNYNRVIEENYDEYSLVVNNYSDEEIVKEWQYGKDSIIRKNQ